MCYMNQLHNKKVLALKTKSPHQTHANKNRGNLKQIGCTMIILTDVLTSKNIYIYIYLYKYVFSTNSNLLFQVNKLLFLDFQVWCKNERQVSHDSYPSKPTQFSHCTLKCTLNNSQKFCTMTTTELVMQTSLTLYGNSFVHSNLITDSFILLTEQNCIIRLSNQIQSWKSFEGFTVLAKDN